MARPKGSKNPNAGAKSTYKQEYNKQVEKLCLLGATDKEIASIFDISVSTLNKWKLDFPKFSESIKKGKEVADATVADKLYNRACGYSHKAVKMFNHLGKVVSENYIEHYPPDTAAAIFWLKNRQPKKWRDKVEHEVGNKDNKPFETKEVGNKGLIEAIEAQADVFRKLGRSDTQSDLPENNP